MAPKLFTLAVAMLAATPMVSAHINLLTPAPFDLKAHEMDKGPMTANEYPCKTQTYSMPDDGPKKVNAGDSVKVTFEGSASHGGGSCQLSITTDEKPTKQSKFKVIESIEGGCPGANGGTNEYNVKIPTSVPNGQVTFAWTWFAKLSGGPEMYMNCAPLQVSGGADDTTEFDKLPDILIANIAGMSAVSGSSDSGSSCTQVTSSDLQFPNPGSVLQKGQGQLTLKAPTGECGSSGSSDSSDSSGSEASTPAASTPAAGAATPAASNPGGVFAPGASPSSTMTTLLTVTAGAGGAAASTPAAVATPAPAAPAGTPSSGGSSGGSSSSSSGSSSGGSTGTCSESGAILCNGTSKFGICNNGNVVWQDVAAGTECKDGAITKRALPHGGRYFRPRGSYL